MDNKEFNLACQKYVFDDAEDMDLLRHFTPATDHNNLVLVIEKMKIDVFAPVKEQTQWDADCDAHGVSESDRDRTTAIIKCICKVLGINYE